MSDMSSDEEGVAAASTTSSLAGSAREADGRERGKRAKDLDIYPTAPRQDKEKSFVWRSVHIYKPFRKDSRGNLYCMACDSWLKGAASQCGDHLRHCHPDEWARVKRLKAGDGEDDTMSALSSGSKKVQTKLHHHQYWRGDASSAGTSTLQASCSAASDPSTSSATSALGTSSGPSAPNTNCLRPGQSRST